MIREGERGDSETLSEGASWVADILILPHRRHSHHVLASCSVPVGLSLKAAMETLPSPSSTQMPFALGDKNVTSNSSICSHPNGHFLLEVSLDSPSPADWVRGSGQYPFNDV